MQGITKKMPEKECIILYAHSVCNFTHSVLFYTYHALTILVIIYLWYTFYISDRSDSRNSKRIFRADGNMLYITGAGLWCLKRGNCSQRGAVGGNYKERTKNILRKIRIVFLDKRMPSQNVDTNSEIKFLCGGRGAGGLWLLHPYSLWAP